MPSTANCCRSDHTRLLAMVIETHNDVAAAGPDPASVMQMIVERARELAHADGAVIEIAEGDEMVCRAACGIVASRMGLTLSPGVSGRCPSDGEPLYCRDAETDLGTNRVLCKRLGIRSMVTVPLDHHGRTAGVLKVVSCRPDAFTEQDISGLQLLTAMLAAALSHAKALDAKKQMLAERTEALAAVRAANDQLRESRDALRVSEEAYRTTFELAGVGMAHTDLETGRFLRVNPKLCEITGYPADELLRLTYYEITHPDDVEHNRATVRHMADGMFGEFAMEKRYVRKDGAVAWIHLTATLIRGVDGKPLHCVAMYKDITGQRRAELLERDRREVLELVVEDRPISQILDRLADLLKRQIDDCETAVMVLDGGAIGVYHTALSQPLLDRIRPGLLALTSSLAAHAWESPQRVGVTDIATHPAWQQSGSAANPRGFKACWAVPLQAKEGTMLGLVTIFSVSGRRPGEAEVQMLQMVSKLASICIENHQATRNLAHLVRHDTLTGLPNRILLEDRLHQALSLAHRGGKRVAVMVLDIDKFKRINDTHGHPSGDQLLQQFANRLRGRLRESDTMARLGGDEFVVVLPELHDREGALAVARKMVAALAEPFQIGEHCVVATSSIGIALFPEDGADAPTLQKKADAALYRVKEQGGNGYSF